MRRSSTVSTSRHLDAVYDPLYLAGSAGPSYAAAAAPSHSAAAAAAAPSLFRPADTVNHFTVRQADGSLASVAVRTQSLSAAAPTSAPVASLRSAVQGANRLKYLKRPLRAFVPPTGQLPDALSGSDDSGGAGGSQSLTSASPFAGRLLHSQLAQQSAAAAHSAASDSDPRAAAAAHPGASSVGVQSVYRESGSQTMPYSPDVLLDAVPSAEVAELLSLQSSLTYANGRLPAMLDAVELVEAAREKQRWEASLPPLDSAAGYAERKRLVEEREWSEWALKEAHIRAEQQRAMLDYIAVQDERAQRQQLRIAEAVAAHDRSAEQRAAEADARQRDEKRRAVRVLGKQRLRDEKRTAFLTGGLLEVDAHDRHFGGGSHSAGGTSASASALLHLSRADAVFGAVHYSSEVYAPLQRHGAAVAYAHKRTVVDFDIPALSDYSTLSRLHSRAVSKAQSDAEREGGGVAGGGATERLRLPSIERPLNRREARERQHLMHVDAQIAEQKEQSSLERDGDDSWTAVGAAHGRRRQASHAAAGSSLLSSSTALPSPSHNVYKHFMPVQRAPTPSLPPSLSADDGRRVAVCLLQRLVRGRAQQSALLGEASRRQHLIREMVQVAQHSHSTAQKEQQTQQTREEGPDEASTTIATGAPTHTAVEDGAPAPSSALLLDVLLGSLFSDAVSSVQSSRQQSDALSALSQYLQQALFVRRVRECEEAGRRQAQEELRRRQDEQFAATQAALQPHPARHHTQHILQRAVAAHVEQQRRDTAQASKLPATACDGSSAAAVIAELLHGVLWPEVELRLARDSVDGRRFIDAAHRGTQTALCTISHDT